jgi:zinc/manganese transport system substrate-binding protein
MRSAAVCTLLASLALVAAGCSQEGSGAGKEVDVVATTTQAADLVRMVGGDRVDVHGLLRPSSDPHDYEPRPSDARALAQARLVVRSGGDVDAWLGDLLREAGGGARELNLIEHVRTRPGAGGELDPHWWQDPRNAILAVAAIRDALTAVDPAGASFYRARARRATARLRALDRGIARCMAAVPARRRKLVTSHDALGYFAARYGIEFVGAVIGSLSTQAQPSARDVGRLVDQIRREGVTTVYPESALNPKLERAIAREAGARVGPPLWADALGPKGSEGATYLDAMAANADAIVRGFTDGRRGCRIAGV